jgi:Trypsin-like peptidase domain
MLSRRVLFLVSLVAIAASFFVLGVMHARNQEAVERASFDAKLEAIRAQLTHSSTQIRTAGTSGLAAGDAGLTNDEALRLKLVETVKQELQVEMGLMPVQLLRERRSSFVELYTEDNYGKTSYGTAGYLGNGYFVTVKHAVVALGSEEGQSGARRIVSIKVLNEGHEVPATLVDAGDAEAEVHPGDWAIIRTAVLDLPALRPNITFAYDFAEPIFRLGNDYSKGIIVSTGYVGQRMTNGLVTALTDGHPGVSGGGVLDRRGDLVGIPIGRMQGDYRFSFILPMRAEMLRRVTQDERTGP